MNNNSKKIVYLGIDVHKRTYSVTAISDKQVIKKATMPAVQEVLLSFIQKNFQNKYHHILSSLVSVSLVHENHKKYTFAGIQMFLSAIKESLS